MLQSEFVGFLRPDQAIETVRDADHPPLVFQEGGFYCSADYGVQARSIAAPGTNADAADVRHAQGSGKSDGQLRSWSKHSAVTVVGRGDGHNGCLRNSAGHANQRPSLAGVVDRNNARRICRPGGG